jgi:hypothetical protein
MNEVLPNDLDLGQLVITTRNIDPDQVQVTVEDPGIGLDLILQPA